jgi:hypothetical protein
MLKTMLESPRRYKAEYIDRKIERKETPALNFGSAIHLALLEPKVFLKRYAVEPALRRNTNLYKEWREAVLASDPTAVILSQEDMDNLHGMIESVLSHSEAASMLRRGVPEQSVYQTVEVDGQKIGVKCRPDWLHENGDIIDLKTTRDAGFHVFRRQLYELKYHVSAAFYHAIVELEFGQKTYRQFWWVAIEKSAPWDVCVYRANDMVLDAGGVAWRKALALYKRCIESSVWPGKQDQPQDIDLPGYAQYES